jgi:FtsH-binding integral membrane protein
MVDVCRECNGVYLDRGELRQIQSFAQSLDKVFTPERKQSQNRRAQFNEAYAAIYHTAEPAAKETMAERTAYIRNVYALLVLTLAITVVGAIIGMANNLAQRFFIPALIVEIIVFLVTLGVRRVPYLNVTMLCTYTFLSGFTLAAVLARYVALGYTACIWQAMAVTTAVFVVLSLYVHITKKDFTWMGGMLFTILIGLVVTGFVFLFFPGSLRIFIWSVVGAVTFCGYILYDTSKIILKYDTSEVVSAVIDLYLDIINLFLDLLRILAYLQGRR